MKEEYIDRACPACGNIIPAKKKVCPSCGLRVGRVNKNPKNPGSYKGYVKPKNLKDLSKRFQKNKK